MLLVFWNTKPEGDLTYEKFIIMEKNGFPVDNRLEAKRILSSVKGKVTPNDLGVFEMYKDKVDEFRFRLFDGYGNNILMSEGYKRKANCVNGIKSVRKNAIDSSKFTFATSKNDKDYFTLRATNGRVIGTSTMHEKGSAVETMRKVIYQAVNEAYLNDLT